MVVEYHDVLADATGGDWETACLVCVDFTIQFNCINKHLMGSDWGSMMAWEDNRGCGNGRFGREYVLLVLFEVSFRS